MNTNPATKPPICAQYATDEPEPRKASVNWYTNQIPIIMYAGTHVILMKKKSGIAVSIFALGNRTMYAPKIPEIAPEAPIAGINDPKLVRM